MSLLWDIYALTYDSGVNSFHIYDELLNKIVQKLDIKENDVIVDSGCGTGNLERKILKKNIKFKKIFGFDISSSMLKRASGKVRSNKIEFLKHDANKKFPFESNSVDKVVMVHTLYAMKSPEATLQEAKRILKKDGALVVANPYDKKNGMEKMKKAVFQGLSVFQKFQTYILKMPIIIINSLIAKFAFGGRYHFISEQKMSELLKKTGFTIPVEYEQAYADTDILFITYKM